MIEIFQAGRTSGGLRRGRRLVAVVDVLHVLRTILRTDHAAAPAYPHTDLLVWAGGAPDYISFYRD